MEVRLTDTGLKLFALGRAPTIISVSDKRAYGLMMNGYANQDKKWMPLYLKNNPVIKKEAPKKSITRKKKREKTTSRRAKKREKAVMED